MGQWSDLPVDLLELVEDNLMLYEDKLRIRAVCLFWYLQLPKLPNRRFPWLLRAVDDNIEASHALFDHVDKKSLFLDYPNLLQGKVYKGSAFGWVVTLEDVYDRKNLNRINLVNPLTGARIELPSRDNFPDVMRYQPSRVNKEYSVFNDEDRDNERWRFYSFKDMSDLLVQKFAMSCDPSSSDGKACVVAVIYGPTYRLACCTLNDKRWKHIPLKSDIECETAEDIIRSREDMDAIQIYGFTEITFIKGKLHGVMFQGPKSQVVAIENITGIEPNPKITLVANHIRNHTNPITLNSENSHFVKQEHLMESSDGSYLMIVDRYILVTEKEHGKVPKTCYFKVYRLDSVKRTSVEMKSIG